MSNALRRVLGIDLAGLKPRQQLEAVRASQTVLRALGEAQDTGTAARADQQYPREEPAQRPPAPHRPDDAVYPSMADLEQGKSEARQPQQSDLDWVLEMWRSGSKYDAAEYILKSNFPYTEFIRLLRQLEPGQAEELGTILDELAPPAPVTSRPNDLISAVAGDTPKPEPPGGPNTPEE